MDTTDEYENKFWSQVNKRKGIEKDNNSLTENINELLTRIHLLEQTDIEGTIIKMNSAFYIINTDIGIFSVHKTKLMNIQFSPVNLNKKCVFNLYYKDNKYNGINLYIEYSLD